MKICADTLILLCFTCNCWVNGVFDSLAEGSQAFLSQQPSERKWVCERSYTNFAWGYQHQGIYVDHQGNLYRYAYHTGDRPWSPQRTDAPTEQELAEKYGHGRELIKRIDQQELLRLSSLLEPASRGPYSRRVQRGADQGAIVSQCYVFDAATGRYKEIELQVAGDWRYGNLAPSAQELMRWLESLDTPH